MKILDWYIIKKFLGTFFFSLAIIIVIAVVFDFSEKVDEFLDNKAPAHAIIFDYYLNFIPYFVVLFAPLFTFISVIFFTSRMAYDTEIIAILSNGVSFRRLLWPYIISATVIAVFSFLLNNYVIPTANAERLIFDQKYYRGKPLNVTQRNIHKQISPGVFIYMENYSTVSNIGYKFSMEEFKNGELTSKLVSEYIRWDTTKNKWNIKNYYIRDYNGSTEKIVSGKSIDTTLTIRPEDIAQQHNIAETMNYRELNDFIEQQRLQGNENVNEFLIEKYRRFSFPFSTFILMIIGISVSSRKVKGGIGVQIGIGLGLSFSYILFMQFSAQFAISGALSPLLAVWIPNIIFTGIAFYLYRLAPK